jgi:site-specific recombinase XerC
MESLRIYHGADDAGLSIRAAFEQYMRAEVERTRAAATLRQYWCAIRHWEEKSPVDDVARVTDADVETWRARMAAAGLVDATVAKTWSFLRSIFHRLGPRGPGNPQGLNLIATVPFCRTPASSPAPHRLRDLAMLERVYLACERATWPPGSPPAAARWRCLVVVAYTWGLRTGDMVDLPASAYWRDAASPDPHSCADHPAGWLVFTPAKTRRRKPVPLILPASRVAADHLLRLDAGDRLLGIPRQNRRIYATWRQICAASGAAALEIKDLRKLCNTQYNRLKTGLGKWVLGHAPRGVNESVYLSVESDLIDAVGRLPATTDNGDCLFDRRRGEGRRGGCFQGWYAKAGQGSGLDWLCGSIRNLVQGLPWPADRSDSNGLCLPTLWSSRRRGREATQETTIECTDVEMPGRARMACARAARLADITSPTGSRARIFAR